MVRRDGIIQSGLGLFAPCGLRGVALVTNRCAASRAIDTEIFRPLLQPPVEPAAESRRFTTWPVAIFTVIYLLTAHTAGLFL